MSRSITEGLIPTIKLVNLSTRGRTEFAPKLRIAYWPQTYCTNPKTFQRSSRYFLHGPENILIPPLNRGYFLAKVLSYFHWAGYNSGIPARFCPPEHYYRFQRDFCQAHQHYWNGSQKHMKKISAGALKSSLDLEFVVFPWSRAVSLAVFFSTWTALLPLHRERFSLTLIILVVCHHHVSVVVHLAVTDYLWIPTRWLCGWIHVASHPGHPWRNTDNGNANLISNAGVLHASLQRLQTLATL